MDEITFLKKLVEIYSPHGRESKASSFLYEAMLQLGYKTSKTPIGNVIGEVGCGKPRIFLCGHMDTVKGRLPVKLTSTRLYGRGVVDAKSALAAMIIAASRLSKNMCKGSVTVAAVVDEEGHSKGMRELIERGVEADYAIFGEPSHLKYITIGYKGSLSVHINVKTRGGHTSTPMAANAIEEAIALWMEVKKSFEKYASKSLRNSITVNISGIKNIGVSYATVYLNIRYPELSDADIIRGDLKKTIREFAEREKIEAELIEDEICPPYTADKKSRLVAVLQQSIKKITGEPAHLITKTGTGDMNIFGNVYNIPTITYGPGDSRLDHTDEEYIELEEYLTAINILEDCLRTLLESG
ncbi:MAG: M20/M25/M40 family metallo-hydrolase [Candidatus Odinarchaeum yellowstonii]|uniref:Putative [LysW]-lysine/[LysW]-ornithine hydrolase n=1 Tax=Odinarchaeota yellowstonii (strain LCB_4) TaxID=1841599 RepID=A0AAF0D2P4_ODILC|nr:MAG: M20/M25/M40 family metallo-hydrolase [Candidatus Odinarchaeum yellowstonii]